MDVKLHTDYQSIAVYLGLCRYISACAKATSASTIIAILIVFVDAKIRCARGVPATEVRKE